jgi:hypothetical protein
VFRQHELSRRLAVRGNCRLPPANVETERGGEQQGGALNHVFRTLRISI